MEDLQTKARLIGALLLGSMVLGALSIAPAIDGADFMTAAAQSPVQVMLGAMAQLLMAVSYLAIAVLFYPLLKPFGASLALGFLSLRIIAAGLVVLGTLFISLILLISQAYSGFTTAPELAAFGHVLKLGRDMVNHGYMIIILCLGNMAMFVLLLRAGLLPRLLMAAGLLGAGLSIIASLLVLFQQLEVITTLYLLLNLPTALVDLTLAAWLLIRASRLSTGAQTTPARV